jgi:predicted nucleic acid-binding protein
MPNIVALDTGPCVALFDRDDSYHDSAVHFVQQTGAALVSTLAVVTEVMCVLRFQRKAQQDFLAWLVAGGFIVVEAEIDDLRRVTQLMDKYADLPMDFTDALLVALCERLSIKQIATVDDDFQIYRLRGRGRFENVFFGGDG